MINVELFINVFTIIGIYYYLKNYSQLKRETIRLTIIFVCVILVYINDWIWKLLIYDIDADLKSILINILSTLKNILLGSIGIYFLGELNLLKIPLLNTSNTINIKKSKIVLSDSLIIVIIFIAITILLLFLNTSNIFNEKIDFRLSTIIDSITRAGIISINEEVYFRLFLLSLFMYWMSKVQYSKIISIFLVSTIWVFTHHGIVESGGFKFIQLFLFGCILGWTQIKKGIETCFLSHWMFNIIAYSVLGNFKIID